MDDSTQTPPAVDQDKSAVYHDGSLSLQEAAARIGVSERTIHRRIRNGTLQAYKLDTPRGEVWRVMLDSSAASPASPGGPGAVMLDGAHGAASPELMRALELIEHTLDDQTDELERLRQERDAERRAHEARVEELHGQIGDLKGIAAHWQARAQAAEETVQRLLAGPTDEPAPAQPERKRAPWWRRLLGAR